MTPTPSAGGSDPDNPWSADRYREAQEEDRASGGGGFRMSGQAAMLILGVLIGIGITIYAAYAASGGLIGGPVLEVPVDRTGSLGDQRRVGPAERS